jgi:hypothetical protein
MEGTYYELAAEVSSSPDDAALSAAIDRLWSAEEISGVKPKVAPRDQMVRSDALLSVDEIGDIPCIVWQIREEGGGADWLTVSIPTVILEPYGIKTRNDELDDALTDIGAQVFPFRLAIIGEEVSGLYSADTLSAAHFASDIRFLLPQETAERLGAKGVEVMPGLLRV